MQYLWCRGRVNHALFECPPVLQTWALSKIPSAPGIFPTASVFTNMDYIFWRLQKNMILTTFHGYYGTFGKIEIIKFLITEMETLRKFFELRK